MSSLERLRDLSSNIDGFVFRKWPARNSLGKSFSLDEFENQQILALDFLDVVNRPDIRMIQRCENLGFTLKSRDPIAVVCKSFREHLDGNIAA